MTPALISEIWISGEAVARVAFKCLGSPEIGNMGTGPDAKINFGDYGVTQDMRVKVGTLASSADRN